MPLRQKIVVLSIAIFIFILVLELVRRRKLREEYSLLWLLTSLAMIILPIQYDWLVRITHLIGAALPTSTLFFFGLMFLIIINIHFSVKVSKLNNQIKKLAQENALLRNRLEKIEDREKQNS
ncbi:MAG: DUF2304 domain-containing protein [Deltaproteobacteria bacterium]|nr:MAG: DUF2304 domain-containing protein [Deltaproteobacteria bacterium]